MHVMNVYISAFVSLIRAVSITVWLLTQSLEKKCRFPALCFTILEHYKYPATVYYILYSPGYNEQEARETFCSINSSI
jgi:hypothetical protein